MQNISSTQEFSSPPAKSSIVLRLLLLGGATKQIRTGDCPSFSTNAAGSDAWIRRDAPLPVEAVNILGENDENNIGSPADCRDVVVRYLGGEFPVRTDYDQPGCLYRQF